MSSNPEQILDEAPSDFLRSLVSAMRRVVEATRDRTLAEMREAVDTEAGQLDMARAAREAALRERAEAEITGIGSWERAEIERIRAEALRKVQARGGQLDQELAELAAATTAEHAALASRADAYEREVAAFIQGLDGIDDPAAFAAAARHMPSPWAINANPPALVAQRMHSTPAAPEADAAEAAAAQQPSALQPPTLEPSTAEPVEAEMGPTTLGAGPTGAASGTERSARTHAAQAAPADVPAAEVVAPGAVAPMTSVAATSPTTKTPEPPSGSGTPEAAAHATSATETSAQAAAPETAAPETAAPETAAPETAAPETAAPEPEPEPADQATSIQVHGLGSFGAITSFKQSLERVDGVRSVTLGLGASGEFVYTATHAAAFDLTRAIRAIEGEGVEIERDNGMLRVKVGKAAQAG